MFKDLGITKYRASGVLLGLLLVFGAAFAYFKYLNVEISQEVEPPAGGSTSQNSPSVAAYQNDTYGFSFQYPEGFKITEFAEERGDVVLVQGNDKEVEPPTGGSTSRSFEFQIFISEFDESGPLTAERIKQDLLGLVIEQPQVVTLGGKTSDVDGKTSDVEEHNVTALVFFGRDSSLGKTREVWFVWPEDPQPAGNYLYQITSAAEFDGELSKIMATFRFN